MAVWWSIITAKLKSAKISYSHNYIISMAIPYQTAKFKSANILTIAILGSTVKFNSRQYFRLYDIHVHSHTHTHTLTLSALLPPRLHGLHEAVHPCSQARQQDRSELLHVGEPSSRSSPAADSLSLVPCLGGGLPPGGR